MSRILHKAYGLSIDSDLPLPELSSMCPDAVDDVDVEIRQMVLGAPERYGALQQMEPFLWGSRSCLWLQIPGVATFLVREGRQIFFDPAAGGDEDSVRLFLLGSAIGALVIVAWSASVIRGQASPPWQRRSPRVGTKHWLTMWCPLRQMDGVCRVLYEPNGRSI